MQYNTSFHGPWNVSFHLIVFHNFLVLSQKHRFVDTQRGTSNDYPQFMLLGQYKKKNLHPYKPHFFLYKLGISRVFITHIC